MSQALQFAPAPAPAAPPAEATPAAGVAPWPPVPPAPPAGAWRLRLLGGFQLVRGDVQIARLPSRAATALLVRIALGPHRRHAREELIELLWPGCAAAVGRNRLRQTLSTLKALLEPPGAPPVIAADRLTIGLVPGAIACDVVAFEALVRERRWADAGAAFGGPLLPGFYDEWIDDERRRLHALFDRASAAAELPARAGADASRATPPDTALAAPPPSRSATAARSAPAGPDTAPLPAWLTRRVGPAAAVEALRSALDRERLVTVTGPGGGGKTRLAVDAARQAQAAGGFERVGFVPLAAAADRASMLDTLAAALGVRAPAAAAGAVPADLAAVVPALFGRRVLLVLDNLEQLVPGGAVAAIGELLVRLPGLHVLATSRRALLLEGEVLHPAEPLPLPAAADIGAEAPGPAALAALDANPAVALFVERARAVRADFHLGARNAAAVAELVTLLGGLPLAIELAAARMRSFSPAQVAAALRAGGHGGHHAGLELLARPGPRAGLDARQASIDAVVAWSWQQLAPAAQQALAACTVFEGGFTAEAAAAVVDSRGPAAASAVAAALDDAVLHGLATVREDAATGQPRLAFFEPVRAWIAARLAVAEQAVLRARARAHWLAWAAALEPATPLPAFRAELPHVLAVLRDAPADGAPADAVRLVLALRRPLNDLALPAGALAHLAAAIAAVAEPALRAPGLAMLAVMRFEAGEGPAGLAAAQAALAASPPGTPWRARSLHALATLTWRVRQDAEAALPLLAEARALAAAADDPAVMGSVAALEAYIANIARRDRARGEALHREALAHWQRLRNVNAVNGGHYNLAICAFNARRFDEAIEGTRRVAAVARVQQDWHRLSAALNVQGNAFSAQRRWPEALAAYAECIAVAHAAGEPHALGYGLWNAPRALAHARQPLEAARLMGAAVAFWCRHFGELSPADARDVERVRRLVAAQAGARAARDALHEGEGMAVAEAIRTLERGVAAGAGSAER
jgi:predicted ATPase